MTARDTLSLAGAAAAVGLSAERFRKVHERWSRELDFPRPFMAPPAGKYAWRRASVAAWIDGREAALGRPVPLTPRGRPATAAIHRERAELRRMLKRA